jgi:hypothetical protein
LFGCRIIREPNHLDNQNLLLQLELSVCGKSDHEKRVMVRNRMREEDRQAIATYIRSLAGWRRRKAEEYDRDARNLRAAAGLEELADYIEALSDDDARIGRLRQIAFTGDLFTPGQQTAYELGRFRFHHTDSRLDAFLDRIVEFAEFDAQEQGRFGGLLPPGDDPWGRT